MLHSDRPITHPHQDVLGRREFAFTLAQSIDRLSVAKDGFVIAIVGEWGTGKTSVIQLIRRYLRHIEMERASHKPLPGHSEASPRTIDELEKMAATFERIEGRIASIEASNKDTTKWDATSRRSDFRYWLESDSAAAVAEYYWQLSARVHANPRTIVVPFSPWLIAGRAELASALLSELARALGPRLGDDVKQAFGALLERLSELAPIAGAGLDLVTGGIGGAFVAAGGAWSGRIGRRLASGTTLEEVRLQLKRALEKLENQRVLVIVDDLDRLTPAEALEMVSLVKTLGDLPNVVYLLGYEESNLVSLIHKAARIDGHDFLDKIVQYAVALPRVEEHDLARLLTADLGEMLGDSFQGYYDRLSVLWYYVLRFYLESPRDVKRFMNALAVSYSVLADHVDPIDLMNVEALRLFEPELYTLIRRGTHDFTDHQ